MCVHFLRFDAATFFGLRAAAGFDWAFAVVAASLSQALSGCQ